MKTFFKLFLLQISLIFSQTFAQSLQTDQSQLNFGNVLETETDSLQLILSNPNAFDVTVSDIKFFQIYGNDVFSTSESNFTINSLGSHNIRVYFNPEHNITHNSEMLIETSGPGGDVSVDLIGQGKYSNTYYSSTENLSEESLKSALKTIITQGYTQLSYSDARLKMFSEIDNQKVNGQGAANDKIECVYTGRTIENYPFSTSTLVNAPWEFNTEHTFPQSLFSQNLPMRSDLFHIFPTDVDANGKRANDPFGNVTTPTWTEGGSEWVSGTFEPRNEQKGKTARAMMYFVLRYQDYSNYFAPQESILRQWHETYLPDAVEKTRCDDIFTYQKNRNPFIDYPQFIERIQKISGTSTAPSIQALYVTDSSLAVFPGVALNDTAFCQVVVSNYGNEAVNLSNIHFQNAAFGFSNNSNQNVQVAAGESVIIKAFYEKTASGIQSDNLLFDTDMSGTSYSVPFKYDEALSLEDVISAEQITVFPNPSSGIIHLEANISKSQTVKLDLVDILGKSLWTKESVELNQENILNFENIPSGIYFLKISNSQTNISKKVILK